MGGLAQGGVCGRIWHLDQILISIPIPLALIQVLRVALMRIGASTCYLGVGGEFFPLSTGRTAAAVSTVLSTWGRCVKLPIASWFGLHRESQVVAIIVASMCIALNTEEDRSLTPSQPLKTKEPTEPFLIFDVV